MLVELMSYIRRFILRTRNGFRYVSDGGATAAAAAAVTLVTAVATVFDFNKLPLKDVTVRTVRDQPTARGGGPGNSIGYFWFWWQKGLIIRPVLKLLGHFYNSSGPG